MFNLVQLLLCGLFNRFVGDFQPNFNLSLQYIHYSSSIWMYSRVPLASASCFVESVRLIGTCESLLVQPPLLSSQDSLGRCPKDFECPQVHSVLYPCVDGD